MLTKRIIPCLDVTAGRVVKGVNFTNLVDAGDPVELAKRYGAEGAAYWVAVRRGYPSRHNLAEGVGK